MRNKNCPNNWCNGKMCLGEGEIDYTDTTCVSCATPIICAGDNGAMYPPDIFKEKSKIAEYPVCHPQDCKKPTKEQMIAWDEHYPKFNEGKRRIYVESWQ